MSNIIDGRKLFLNGDKLLTLEFNETMENLINSKIELMDEILIKFENSTSDGERDALAILMRAEIKTLEILKSFKDQCEEDLENM